MPVYQYTITMLSPVHIGSGEEIGPHEYVIRGQPKGEPYELHVIDLPAFLGSLTDEQRRRFDEAKRQSAMFYIRKFVADNVDTKRFTRYVAYVGEQMFHRYEKALTNDTGQLIVNTMLHSGLNNRPLIPGSSIKGAIRTAVISRAAADPKRKSELAIHAERDRLFEGSALNYLKTGGHRGTEPEIRADPFRAVKISDAQLPSNALFVDSAEIFAPGRSAGASDPAGIQMYYEMTYSILDNETIEGTGSLVVDDRLARKPVTDGRRWEFKNCVSRAISIDEILSACREFYRARLEDECKNFYQKKGKHTAGFGEQLRAAVSAMRDNETLIRLGRFSHFECVTIPEFARPPKRGVGKTRTLATGELPFGWVKLRVEKL